jgi:hypothetical protein
MYYYCHCTLYQQLKVYFLDICVINKHGYFIKLALL